MNTRQVLFGTTFVVALLSASGFGLVKVTYGGKWPTTWPEELETLRRQATSLGQYTSIQQELFEIPFRDAEEFQRAWPHILKVRTHGGPILIKSSPLQYSFSEPPLVAGVRILAPVDEGELVSPNPNHLRPGPPWPDAIKTPSGGLPEYVTGQDGTWIDAENSNTRRPWLFRARVDVVLVVDGDVVNLENVEFPDDATVIDTRVDGWRELLPDGIGKRLQTRHPPK